jgi:alkaline phosphatase/streptomycin-6-phosphatase
MTRHPSSNDERRIQPVVIDCDFKIKHKLVTWLTISAIFLIMLISANLSLNNVFSSTNSSNSTDSGNSSIVSNPETTGLNHENSTTRNGSLNDVTNDGLSLENGIRNIILLIGDGMGDSEITMARNYEVGADGKLVMDTLPFTGAVTTYSVEENDSSVPYYVTDSAAAGTAWATGNKTSNGRISSTPSTDLDLKTILELAQESGLGTGIVTTAELTDATPAVLASHISNRDCQGPTDPEMNSFCTQDKKLNGGPGSIAEQMIDHDVDILFGGGKQRFDQVIESGNQSNQTVVDSAISQGYSVITTAAELENVTYLQSSGINGTNATKILGLFAQGNMNMSWKGEPALTYPGSGPQVCQENQKPQQEPSLTNMTAKAIGILDEKSRSNDKGFFLQIEVASIDKRAHDAEPCEQIGETIAFDNAVKEALEFAASNPETLVIVTADHAHTPQIIPMPEEPEHPGYFSTLVTKEGANMTINYATSPLGESLYDQDHTGSQVRIAAQGPNAQNVLGVIDQTDLFNIMKTALFGG